MMDKTTKTLIGIAVILIVVMIALVNVNFSGNAVSDDTIKIGSIVPLTGDAAAYGFPIQQAADLAVSEINAAGGVNGKNLEIIYEDGLCDSKGAATAAQKLINIDGVKVILGGMCSGETLGAAPIAEQSKTILFSPGSGSPDITNSGDFIFRNFPSDASSGSKVARYAIEQGDTKIAIIAEQTAYAQSVKNVFKETFVDLGGEIVAEESYNSDSVEFRSQITRTNANNPDGVYLLSQTLAKFGLLIKQLDELGVNKQIYTNEFAASGDILGEYAEEIDGAVFAEPAFDPEDYRSKEFLDKIIEKHGELSGALPPIYLSTAYDAIYILAEAIEECSEDTDCIKDELYSIKDRKGAAGLLSIDENGDAEFEYILKFVENGQVEAL